MDNIPECTIKRVEEGFSGTFGVFLWYDTVFCVTLEPPDYNNARNISSIPTGRYLCQRYKSQKYDTYEITQVPGRDHILFHAGNTIEDTAGCPILGQHFGKLRGNRAVLNSGNTFREWMHILDGDRTFWLTIKEM
jgi:hypothetical protein